MTIEIVDFPINSMVIFNSYVKLPEGKTWKISQLLVVHQKNTYLYTYYCWSLFMYRWLSYTSVEVIPAMWLMTSRSLVWKEGICPHSNVYWMIIQLAHHLNLGFIWKIKYPKIQWLIILVNQNFPHLLVATHGWIPHFQAHSVLSIWWSLPSGKHTKNYGKSPCY